VGTETGRRGPAADLAGLPPGAADGGSLQLVKLIDEHGPALVADFAHYYHRDLRDLWRDDADLTPRLAIMLAGQLPEGSAFFASIQGGARYRSWTLQNQLLGFIGNSLYAANRQRAGKPTKKLPINPPKPSIKGRRAQTRRVQRIAGLPSARRIAGS
jgi:hypothetical protein